MPSKPRTSKAPRARTRKPPATKPKPGVLQLDRQENKNAIEAMLADREPLFAIGDTEYTIPKAAPAAWTVQATKLARTQGAKIAMDYALKMMLGDAGYEALSECDTLTQADFEIFASGKTLSSTASRTILM